MHLNSAPSMSFVKTKLTSLLSAALLCSSLTLSAQAKPIPEGQDALQRANKLESRARRNTIRDAKGNRIRLSSTPQETPNLWAHLDLEDDKVPGTSTAKAYSSLNLKAPEKPVIVAVIDSGVDTRHPDLQGMIWVNEKEANGQPGVDDDGDGYVDNVNGWNFIGNKDGTNLNHSNLELTREVKRMRLLQSTRALTPSEKTYLVEIEEIYEKKKAEATRGYEKYSATQAKYLAALTLLRKAGLTEETLASVRAFPTNSDDEKNAKDTLLWQLEMDRDSKVLAEIVNHFDSSLRYHLNQELDPSKIIGDNPKNPYDRYYGNPDVKAIGAEHGTHCAGIIGALRNNGIGLDGQSNYLRLMPIRAVPDGDERDKDIANAIRFAVDHGAKIVSMSFGKPYSPGKKIVDLAVAYAQKKGVLLVHAAGNDGHDNDTGGNFPTAVLSNGQIADNWIEVGASTAMANENLPADFSNYGRSRVDLFAPGHDIYSTTPDGTYAVYSGTSMAAPEVAGIAALLLSQNPNLTAAELKKIITSTVTTFPGLEVLKPSENGDSTKVPFSSLSSTGGVVNALRALRSL